MTPIAVRIIIFLVILFLVGELLKRTRRAKTKAVAGQLKFKESIAVSSSCTVAAVEYGSQVYLLLIGGGGGSLIDKLPLDAALPADLKQRRIDGI